MAASTVGVLSTYVEGEDFTAWLERLEQHFVANDVAAEKRVAVLLTVLGDKTYGLLRSLVAPSKPAEKTFKQLTDLLCGQLEPKRLVVAERFQFSRRSQREGEAVMTYVAELKRLAVTCDFGTTLGERLRDAFVAGVRNPGLQKRLLTEADDLTLETACQIALSMESAETQAQRLRTLELEPAGTIHRTGLSARDNRPHGSTREEEGEIAEDQGACFRCLGGHLPSRCRFRRVKCRTCQKTGHIARACPENAKEREAERRTATVNYISPSQEPITDELSEDFLIY